MNTKSGSFTCGIATRDILLSVLIRWNKNDVKLNKHVHASYKLLLARLIFSEFRFFENVITLCVCMQAYMCVCVFDCPNILLSAQSWVSLLLSFLSRKTFLTSGKHQSDINNQYISLYFSFHHKTFKLEMIIKINPCA